jgi:RHS repeat-associated protein
VERGYKGGVLNPSSQRTGKRLRALVAVFLAAWVGDASAQQAFMHQVPLKLPKGAHGFQPEIALVYSSTQGNGPLGMGWQLTGLEWIARVNYGKGIRYAGADTYAHSQLGVLVRQIDGTYRSKKESFTQFIPSTATCGDGPCTWSTIDRSGVTRSFGTTSDSTLLKSGTASVRTWGLSRVMDPNGNYYDVVYNTSLKAATNKLLPDHFQYTMGNGLLAFRTVTFGYASGRQDTESGYPQGDLESCSYLLTSIVVSSDGAVLHQYVLNYGAGSVTGRSVLLALKEFGPGVTTGAMPLLNQSFAWSQGTEAAGTGFPASAPDLLTRVDNGTGGAVVVEYQWAAAVANAISPSSPAPGVPNASPRMLETKLTVSDGRGGSYSTHYEYFDGRFLPGSPTVRRELGFGYVQTVDDQTGLRRRSTYRQDAPYEGLVSAEESWTNSGLQLARVVRSYQPLFNLGSTGTEYVVENQTTTYTYELGTLGFRRVDARTFDEYGNVTILSQDAGPANLAYDQPNVTITTTYANNPASWTLGHIAEIKTTSGSKVLARSQNVWNGNNLTAKSEWLDTGASCPTGCWVTTAMGYDAFGNMTSVTEPATGDGLTRVTTTDFDAKYHAYPVKVANALNQTSRRAYNEDGQIVSYWDANNQLTTTTYDVYGRKSSETRPDTGVTQYAYVNYGDASQQYDETVSFVDSSRVVWKREFFDGSGFKYLVKSSGDCGSLTLTVANRAYQYVEVATNKDSAGRPGMVSQPNCGGSSRSWSTTVYDAAGRPSYVQTPDGKSLQYTYGANYRGTIDANLKETRKYFNSRDEVTAVVFPYGDPAAQTTTYTYDELRRIQQIALPDGSAIVYAYDSLNRRTSVTAPLGAQPATTTYSYDVIGNVLSTSSAGTTVTMTYDRLNRITLRQPLNETATIFGYDETVVQNGIGRLTSLLDAGGKATFSYTATGNLLGRTKSIGTSNFTQTQAYDRGGRLTRLTYPDGSYADYTYSDGGYLASLALNGVAFGTWSAYDASGRPGNVALGNGVNTNYSYAPMGQLSTLVTMNAAGGSVQDLSYDWYSLPNTAGLTVGSITDRRLSKTVGGYNTDETQSYTYDSLGRLTNATGAWGTKAYTYDALGNPQVFGGSITRTLSYVGQQVQSGTGLSGVAYDALGNMTSKTLDGVTWNYTWTAEGRLASVTRNGLVAGQMTYDANGTRVQKVYTPSSGPTVTTAYFYDLYEKRTFSDGSAERHTLHLIANGQILASVTKSGSILTATNGAMGWRQQVALGSLYSSRSVGGLARKAIWYAAAMINHPATQKWWGFSVFTLIGMLLLAILARSSAMRLYRIRVPAVLRLGALAFLMTFGAVACSGSGPGSPPRIVDTSRNADLAGNTTQGPPAGTIFYHRNHINSSTVITDATGAELSRIVYLPFGEICQPHSAGTDIATTKFTGKELDEETGLYFFGARYYDPSIGRFISADSLAPSLTDAQAFSRYSYTRNNPIAYVDPTGHAFEFIGKVFRAVGDALSAIGEAAASAVRWMGTAVSAAGDFIQKAGNVAWQFLRGMARDPSTYLSLALALCTLNPVVITAWFISTAASIAAASLAVAAGVRNPLVVSLISAVAGAAGAGAQSAAQFAKTVGAWAVGQGLQRLEQKEWGGKVTQWLGVVNSMLASQVVNAVAGTAKWVITPFGAMDPPGGDSRAQLDLRFGTDSLASKWLGVVGGIAGATAGLATGLLTVAGGEIAVLGLVVVFSSPLALTAAVLFCVGGAAWAAVTAVQSGIDIYRGNYYGGSAYSGRRRRRCSGRSLAFA